MSYESPIRLIEDTVKIEIENMVVRAVQNYDLTIDKDALIKALNYDREQYEKGFEDGKAISIETEAIPIEWIKERMNNIEDTMLEMAWSMLISDWEERKEK